jgi:hypothetical protein
MVVFPDLPSPTIPSFTGFSQNYGYLNRTPIGVDHYQNFSIIEKRRLNKELCPAAPGFTASLQFQGKA